MGSAIRVELLGEFAILGGGARLVLPTRKTRALAAYQALSSLRDTLGSSALQCDDDTVLCRADAFACDAWEFETLAHGGKLAEAERARSLYRGELLAGCEIVEPAFVEWLQPERTRFRELARRVLGSILVHRCDDAELREAVATANALLRIDPFDEAVHRTLMQLHVRNGRINAALRHYHEFSRMLRREIGVGPEDETIALYDRLAAQRSAVSGPNTLAEYAFVLEQVSQCIVVTDCSSRIVGWNRFAEERLGFTKDFMFGRKPTFLYAPVRDQSIADDVLRTVLQRGHWSGRVKLLAKDGHELYQTRTVQPLFDRQGLMIGAFGTGVPV